MEVLKLIVFKNCGSDELFEKLNLSKTDACTVSPSYFIEEMKYTTEQRLEKIKNAYFRNKTGKTDLEIDIIPNVIIIQNFLEGSHYDIPVSVINIGKYPTAVKFNLAYTPYVSIICPSTMIPAKLAPGMELQFIIAFKPETRNDFWHKVEIITSNRKYYIPIIAIGPRPMLTFPDNINMLECPVDIGTERCLHVKNIGEIEGVFKVYFNPPFNVEPAGGIIESNATMQFVIQIRPKNEGQFKDSIIIKFETGESIQVNLEVNAKCLKVRLSKSDIHFEDTYMGLKCQVSVQIHNESDHIVEYNWKKFNSHELDKIEVDKMKENFDVVRDLESRKNAKLQNFDAVSKDLTDIIYERIYSDELIDFDKTERFLFNNFDFQIIPLSGEIYPHHTTEIQAIFTPKSINEKSAIAYCELTGKIERLPLKLHGTGIGPKFVANIDILDLNDIYLFADQFFQIVFTNNGNIPGEISYLPRKYSFEAEIYSTPKLLYLKPFENAAFTMFLKCLDEGSFLEDLHFIIAESKEIIKVFIKGKVIYAKLMTNVPSINFGTVPLGAKEERIFILINKTTIDIPYDINIYSGKKRIPSMTITKSLGVISSNDIPKNPEEYYCEPSSGIVKANSNFEMRLFLTPNISGTFSIKLKIDCWSSVNHRTSVTVTHTCSVPLLECNPSAVNIRFCFLNYLSQRLITIKNRTSLHGYIWFFTEAKNGIQVTSDVSEMYVEPYCIIEVSLGIICTELGKQQAALKYILFGGEETIACNIECIGQGPVVLIIPETLNFGKVKLLEKTTNTLTVFNDSPTLAEVDIYVKKSGPWSVNPNKIIIEPEESQYVEVSCLLNDTTVYRGKVMFNIQNRGLIDCPVTARGIGTSILVTPPVSPILDLGSRLTKTPFTQKLLVKNMGVRYHKINVSPYKIPKQNPKPEDIIETLFTIQPNQFSLKPGEEITLAVSIQSNEVIAIEERFYFNATIEKIEKKQLIIETLIKIQFVEPVFILSKTDMYFRVDNEVDSIIQVNTDIVEIINVTPVPLDVEIIAKPPFYVLLENDQKTSKFNLNLDHNDNYFLEIYFDSATDKKVCFTIDSEMEIRFKGHCKKEIIFLHGTVNFPNIKFSPDHVTFKCTLLDTYPTQNVEIRNISPLPLSYHLEYCGEFTKILHMPRVENKILYIDDDPISFLNYTYSTEFTPSEDLGQQSDIGKKINKSKRGSKIKEKTGKTKKVKEESDDVSPLTVAFQTKKLKKSLKAFRKSAPLLPFTILFQHYYEEIPVVYHEITICEKLLGPISKSSLIQIPQRNMDNLMQLKQNLYSVTKEYVEETNYDILRCMIRQPEQKKEINEILIVTPSFGYLDPYESQFVSIVFHPMSNLEIKTKVACYVSGGPVEYLSISAISTAIHYYLETTHIDFGRRLFNEYCKKPLKIINTGFMPFTVYIKNAERDVVQTIRLMEVGWFEIHPKSVYLKPQEAFSFSIIYTPGVGGKFSETFDLEIGDLPSIPITITGYGVFPQVFLNLPRPAMCSPDSVVCYNAIANITSYFLKHLELINDWNCPANEHFVNDITIQEKRILMRNGWVIVNYDRNFPSEMDIALAVERMLAVRHMIRTYSSFLDSPNFLKIRQIPGLVSPEYILNFNYVIIDSIVHYTILLINYGPTTVVTKIAVNLKNKDFVNSGFTVQLNNGTINYGDSAALFIIFNPSSEMYPNRVKEIEYTLYLQVVRGPKIPISLRAIVTKPFIEASCRVLNFEHVICGTCKVKNVILINNGFVSASWTATIFQPSTLLHIPGKPKINLTPIFFLNSYTGKLEPGESISLDVTYEPIENQAGDWRLKIILEQSDEQIIIALRGHGIMPALNIDVPMIHFFPCVPYNDDSVEYFTIENKFPYPIEYFFPVFDKQIFDEDTVIDFLCDYYGTAKLYIPQRIPGEKLPHILFDFIDELLIELKLHIIQNQIVNLDDSNAIRVLSVKSKRLKRKKTIDSAEFKPTVYVDPLENKTAEEIRILLKEFIAYKVELHANDSPKEASKLPDPIQQAFLESKEIQVLPEPEIKEGILFIFHGAPHTEFVYAANKLARILQLPIYSLDDLICEAIASNSSMSSVKINEIINDAFFLAMNYSKVTSLKSDDLDTLDMDNFDNPFVMLKNKIRIILTRPVGKLQSAKSSKSKSTNKSDKSEKKKDKRKSEHTVLTFLGIPLEFLQDLLRQKLNDFKCGLIIESLNNIFIKNPILTLNTLLLSAGNLRYINVFMLFKSAKHYQEELEEVNVVAQIEKEHETMELLKQFDVMSESEFDALTPAQKELYKNVYVAKRKEESAKRLEQLKIKKKMLKTKKAKSVKKTKVDGKLSIAASYKMSHGSKKSSVIKSQKSSEKSVVITKAIKRRMSDRKLTVEEVKKVKEYDQFNDLFMEITHIMEFWDKKNGVLLKPYVAKKVKSGKKGKKEKKMSSKGSKAPTSKTRSTPSSPENYTYKLAEFVASDPYVGIPYYILNNPENPKTLIENVAYFLLDSQEYQEACKLAKERVKKKIIDTQEIFSILRKPVRDRVQSNSPVFTIFSSNLDFSDLHEDSVSSNAILKMDSDDTEGTKKIMKEKRKKKKSHNVIPSTVATVTSSLMVVPEVFENRTVLEPGQRKYYKIKFSPKAIGHYEYKYDIELTGYKIKYSIHCRADCDIPRIDMSPSTLFPGVLRAKPTDKEFYSNVYIKKTGIFDFGAMLISRNTSPDYTSYFREAYFHLKNISLVPCEVQVHFIEETSIFKSYSDVLFISPGLIETLVLNAFPTSVGSFTNFLALAVKNNPRIEIIPVRCTGAVFEFEIPHKKLIFERVLLGHSLKKNLKLVNKSKVPISFQFTNANKFYDNFYIGSVSGVVKPMSNLHVTLEYLALQVEHLVGKKLFIEIYNQFNTGYPLLTDFIELYAETVDLVVDCQKTIKYGDIKARKNYDYVYTFLNKGKYNIAFEITPLLSPNKEKNNKQNIVKMFKINNNSGVLIPQKPTNVIITFHALRKMELKDFPVFNCSLLDHINKNVLLNYVIHVCARADYTRFELYPLPEINFGAMIVGSSSSQIVTLKNTGTIEFSYQVLCKRTLDALQAKLSQKASKSSKKSSARSSVKSGKKSDKSNRKKSEKGSKKKSEKSSKIEKVTLKTEKVTLKTKKSNKSTSKGSKQSKKERKIKSKKSSAVKLGPPINCGVFTVKNSKGTVKPNEKTELEILCYLNDSGPQTEVVICFVSETNPIDRSGKVINLKANGCIPTLNTDDVDSVFCEHYIVNSINDFMKPKDVEIYTVFTKDKKRLIFNNVCINNTATARLQLFNNSLVEAEVNFRTTPPNIFNLPVTKLFIPSYTRDFLKIEFTPSEIEKYDGQLDIQIVQPPGYKSENKIFLLQGEGRVPEITLLEPPIINPIENKSAIKFNPTILKKSSSQIIKFINSGDFPCKVILELFEDEADAFSFDVDSSTAPTLHCPEAQNTKHFKMIKLVAEEIATIRVSFQPKVTKTTESVIRIHIINNPFEFFTINLSGLCFEEDIILHDLPTNPIDNQILATISDISLINQYGTTYQLNFNRIYINSLEKIRFKIQNQNFVDMYKFVFRSPIPEITFIPAVGHLLPNTVKYIFATYITQVPINISKLIMDCVVCKIFYNNSELYEKIAWDERQRLVIFDEKHDLNGEGGDVNESGRVVESCPEPPYEVVEESIKRIPIVFSTLANYSQYECDIGYLRFVDTFILEKKVHYFTIRNTGEVDLEVNWLIQLESYLRLENVEKKALKALKELKNYVTKNKPNPFKGNENFFGDQCKSLEEFSIMSSIPDLPPDKIHMPFIITPSYILLPPKQETQIKLIFSPLDAFEYKARLKGSIKNLPPNQKGIDVEIEAKSLMSCVYFDVKLSDFITSGNRKQTKCDENIDENTKCIEFDCIGVSINHEKLFNIINPTEEDVLYTWKLIRSSEIDSVALFTCHQLSGKILKGKLIQAKFSIFPQTTGTFEALFNFKIEKYNLIMPFLFVANVKEPNVYFLSSHIDMKPTIMNISVNDFVILRNDEDIDLAFLVKKNSLYSEGRKQFVNVEPKKGVIKKKSDQRFKLTYNPLLVGKDLFSIQCFIEFCQSPIILRISTKCYEVESSVFYATSGGKKLKLSDSSDNFIDLGDMLPNHEETLTFYIRNDGSVGFYFQWTFNEENIERNFYLKTNLKEGYIKSNTEIQTFIGVTPLKYSSLRNHKMELSIKYGPTFKILLCGSVSSNVYKFSFMEFDFGPCFIQNSKICYNHKILEFFNEGVSALMLECSYFNTDYLSVDFRIRKVLPKSRETIHLCFHPQKIAKYVETINFSVNSQNIKIVLKGEGIKLNICLVNMEDKNIIFGSPQVGTEVSKTVKVINKSPIAIKALFNFWDQLPIVTQPLPPELHYLEIPKKQRILEEEDDEIKTKKKGKHKGRLKDRKIKKRSRKSSKSSKKSTKTKKTKRTKRSKSSGKTSKKTKSKKSAMIMDAAPPEPEIDHTLTLYKSMLSVIPKGYVTIPSYKTAEFTVTYLPTQKIKPFTDKIAVQVLEMVEPLCIVQGACLGPVFFFDRDEISFGVIVQGCIRESKLILFNEGDVSSNFKWEIDNEDYEIFPKEGYTSSGTTVTFTVSFLANKLNIQSICKAALVFEKHDKPLILTLIGICSELPSPAGTLNFECPARSTDKKTVIINNITGQNWKIKPFTNHEYFTCSDKFIVKARSTANFEIIYEPLVMSRKTLHTGAIYFRLPTGQAIVYNLVGRADGPDPVNNLILEIPCKKKHLEILEVKNWLKYKQTFKVFVEDITPGNEVNIYETFGFEFIEVAGYCTHKYEWGFYGYKEGQMELRVIFMNDSKEYLYYHILIKLTKPKTLQTFELSTCVRHPIIHKLRLINPLDNPINYKLFSNNIFLTYPATVTVNPHGQTYEDIEYYPVLTENVTTTFEAACQELGTYLYEFKLTALPALPEPVVNFEAILGKNMIKYITLKNLAKTKAMFTSKCDNPVFKIASITNLLNSGQSLQIPINFNPFKLGKMKGTLTITSATGGDYCYPLVGICTPPKPKGPYIIKGPAPALIEFTNPFLEDATFIFVTEPSIFFVNNNEELCKSKVTMKILVQMKEDNDTEQKGKEIIGKLIIMPKNIDLEDVKWTYYLKGILK